jgi:hypothetical protein
MSPTSNASGDQDWRLKAELDHVDKPRSLERLLGHARTPAIVQEVEAGAPPNVVITHDGSLLFAYAADEATLKAARSAIEAALRHEGLTASLYISHWDDQLDDWHQVDPPLSAQEKQAQVAAERDAERIETRTLVASVGKMIRAEFEQSLLGWAEKLGVECKILEHPHLLTTQVGFTLTGPRGKLDEFARALDAEEHATIRAETNALLSPL